MVNKYSSCKKNNHLGRHTSEREAKYPTMSYLVVGEGLTEIQYFKKISELYKYPEYPVHLRVVDKPIFDREKTSPSELYDFTKGILVDQVNGKISRETIAEYLVSWVIDKKFIFIDMKQEQEIENALMQYFIEASEDLGISLPQTIDVEVFKKDRRNYEQKIRMILELGLETYSREFAKKKQWIINDEIICSFVNYFIEARGVQDEKFDCACIIYDRDDNRKENYHGIFEKIKIDSLFSQIGEIKPYITSPCFEFWLLMHIDKAIEELDKETMRRNDWVSTSNNTREKLRHSEYILKQYIPNYTKTTVNTLFPTYFEPNIDTAIRNEKRFCENIKNFEINIGSNVGKLIEELRDPSLRNKEKDKHQIRCFSNV